MDKVTQGNDEEDTRWYKEGIMEDPGSQRQSQAHFNLHPHHESKQFCHTPIVLRLCSKQSVSKVNVKEIAKKPVHTMSRELLLQVWITRFLSWFLMLKP